ncbi:hypothetical protein F7210_04855 [Helicobacter pylori]|nr:hypothetical protein [Helicobacter pylori]
MILVHEFLRSSSAINSTNGLKWDLYNNNSSTLKSFKNFCFFLSKSVPGIKAYKKPLERSLLYSPCSVCLKCFSSLHLKFLSFLFRFH